MISEKATQKDFKLSYCPVSIYFPLVALRINSAIGNLIHVTVTWLQLVFFVYSLHTCK